jgi:hypothetical protein
LSSGRMDIYTLTRLDVNGVNVESCSDTAGGIQAPPTIFRRLLATTPWPESR